jgi:uncharacterized protein (DUF3084 family)
MKTPERNREYCKSYYERHREERLEYSRQYYAANKEKVLARQAGRQVASKPQQATDMKQRLAEIRAKNSAKQRAAMGLKEDGHADIS